MSITIRQATEADLEDVLALYEGIEDSAQQVLSLEEARAMLAQFARYPSYRLWVACDVEQRGAVVGSYALLVMHKPGAPGGSLGDCRGRGGGAGAAGPGHWPPDDGPCRAAGARSWLLQAGPLVECQARCGACLL